LFRQYAYHPPPSRQQRLIVPNLSYAQAAPRRMMQDQAPSILSKATLQGEPRILPASHKFKPARVHHPQRGGEVPTVGNNGKIMPPPLPPTSHIHQSGPTRVTPVHRKSDASSFQPHQPRVSPRGLTAPIRPSRQHLSLQPPLLSTVPSFASGSSNQPEYNAGGGPRGGSLSTSSRTIVRTPAQGQSAQRRSFVPEHGPYQ
jgi:hypothetical protein